MRILKGGAGPDNLASGMTITYALGMNGYCTVRDASNAVSQQARSWYERSDVADILELTGGLTSVLCVGPAKSLGIRLGLCKRDDFPHMELAKIFMQGALYVGRRITLNTLNDGVARAAKSFNSYIDPIMENPWSIAGVPLFLLAMTADVAAGLIEHYETTH